MAIDYKLIGQRIKEVRLEKKITQEVFAENMNVSVGYISQLERGITKVSLERLSAISDYFGCDITFFLNGISSQKPDYLLSEIDQILNDSTAKERKIIYELLTTYKKNIN